MIIELMRAHTPDGVGREADCAICARRFRTEVVLAQASTEDGTFMGEGIACPACVEALGAYLPAKFPNLEEFEQAKRRFEGPIWESTEAASDAWNRPEHYEETLAASHIERA